MESFDTILAFKDKVKFVRLEFKNGKAIFVGYGKRNWKRFFRRDIVFTTIMKISHIKSFLMTVQNPEYIADKSVNIASYMDWVMQGFMQNSTNTNMDLAYCSMGMNAELGEVVDIYNKHLFHGHTIDKTDLTMEYGDLLWYFIASLSISGISLTEVIKSNQIKLNSRYPEGRRDLAFRNKKLEYSRVRAALGK